MKQTVREKDIPDRVFLLRLLKAQGIEVKEAPRPRKPTRLEKWLRRVFGAD